MINNHHSFLPIIISPSFQSSSFLPSNPHHSFLPIIIIPSFQSSSFLPSNPHHSFLPILIIPSFQSSSNFFPQRIHKLANCSLWGDQFWRLYFCLLHIPCHLIFFSAKYANIIIRSYHIVFVIIGYLSVLLIYSIYFHCIQIVERGISVFRELLTVWERYWPWGLTWTCTSPTGAPALGSKPVRRPRQQWQKLQKLTMSENNRLAKA